MSMSGSVVMGPRPPKRFEINSNSGSIDQIAAVAGPPTRRIRITSLVLKGSGAGSVIFNSNTTEIGRVTFTANDPPLVLPFNPDGWLETASGEKLNLGNASTLTLSGFGTYVEM